MLKNNLAKLLKVKSIVTLLITFCFCYLSVSKTIDVGNFMEIFKLIIVFYFGSQVGKHEAEVEKEIESGVKDDDKDNT